MTKKEQEYCRYSSLKVDAEVLPLLKIAAVDSGKSSQELASDILNEACAKIANRPAVRRKPPRPKESGRPRKS